MKFWPFTSHSRLKGMDQNQQASWIRVLEDRATSWAGSDMQEES